LIPLYAGIGTDAVSVPVYFSIRKIRRNQVTPNTRRFGISERKAGINSPDFYYQEVFYDG